MTHRHGDACDSPDCIYGTVDDIIRWTAFEYHITLNPARIRKWTQRGELHVHHRGRNGASYYRYGDVLNVVETRLACRVS